MSSSDYNRYLAYKKRKVHMQQNLLRMNEAAVHNVLGSCLNMLLMLPRGMLVEVYSETDICFIGVSADRANLTMIFESGAPSQSFASMQAAGSRIVSAGPIESIHLFNQITKDSVTLYRSPWSFARSGKQRKHLNSSNSNGSNNNRLLKLLKP